MSVKFSRKEQKVHNCPICGELTAGTVSEGGVLFSVCEECYQGRYQEREEERRDYERRDVNRPGSPRMDRETRTRGKGNSRNV